MIPPPAMFKFTEFLSYNHCSLDSCIFLWKFNTGLAKVVSLCPWALTLDAAIIRLRICVLTNSYGFLIILEIILWKNCRFFRHWRQRKRALTVCESPPIIPLPIQMEDFWLQQNSQNKKPLNVPTGTGSISSCPLLSLKFFFTNVSWCGTSSPVSMWDFMSYCILIPRAYRLWIIEHLNLPLQGNKAY